MPVILPRESESDWLTGGHPDLDALRRPFPSDQMIAYPVSPRVNSVKYDDPSLVRPTG
jgi:putative SOS response-associated peptidase YedK